MVYCLKVCLLGQWCVKDGDLEDDAQELITIFTDNTNAGADLLYLFVF